MTERTTTVIYCKSCGGMFYATARVTPEDALEIVEYVAQGHRMARVSSETVRANFGGCTCGRPEVQLTLFTES